MRQETPPAGRTLRFDRSEEGPPTRIGEYVVVRLLGEGGMGLVFECHDEKLERTVAIKVLRAELVHEAGMASRFLREARAMAKVSSPHIVTVHAVGEAAEQPFIVMEKLDGEDLSQTLHRRARLPRDELIAIGLDTIAGLRAAAGAGVVHRDVKPANLFVVHGRVKITDFGLARPLDGSANVTQKGLVVGTPYYLAPELVRGGNASVASDIYALGATLYELACGRPPHEGATAVEVLTAQIGSDAPPLAPRAPQIGVDLADVIHRMLARALEKRITDYDTLESALRALPRTDSQPLVAAPPPSVSIPPRVGGETLMMTQPTPPHATATNMRASAALPQLRTENLTVMFTDIAGYTERTGQQSREESARWLAMHDALLHPVIRAFGGTIVKTIGDALLVTFRSPTDAVLCGCAIQDRFFAHNQTAPASDRIDVKVALSAGEVRLQRGDIFGEPVNLAARLEQLCHTGEVLLSDAVFSTMNTAEVSLAPRGQHTLKGIRRQVSVYVAVPDGVPGQAPFGNRALSRVTSSFVAEALRTAWQFTRGVLARYLSRGRGSVAVSSAQIRPITRALWIVVPLVALAVLVTAGLWYLRPTALERVAKGEAREVLAEIDKIPDAQRSGEDEAVRGHALLALGDKDKGFAAFAVAAQKGHLDAEARRKALQALDDSDPDAARAYLKMWPDAAIVGELQRVVVEGTWWPRHHALTILDEREQGAGIDRQAFAIKDLEEGDSCLRRRMGLQLLRRVGKGDEAVKAVQRAGKRMPDNTCMMFELGDVERAVKKR